MKFCIDEFRIRLLMVRSRFRIKLAEFLIKIISKLDCDMLSSCTIDSKYSCNIKKIVPQDGEWHHFAHTVDCWIKFHEEVKNEKIYLDGNEVNKKGKKK